MAPVQASAFAPASVGNVGVGFDVLGHTIAGIGDRVMVRRIAEPTVRIVAIRGVALDLPYDATANTAGAALIAMRESLGLRSGFEIELDKGIALGSGMGGSAASCVAALVAANSLLENPLEADRLYPFALAGETLASGGMNGDNVGPMLLGGLVLATRDCLVRIPVPGQWHCVVVHPEAVLRTLHARDVLKSPHQLSEFVTQSGNLALLIAGCFRGDASLVRKALHDVLVEPRRAPLVTGFAAVKNAALDAGAMGSSISGAGPSVFAWFESKDAAQAAIPGMREGFSQCGLASQAWLSPIAGPAARLLP